MVKETICVDTSLFIDYFRKQRKDKTFLVNLSERYEFAISVITKLEIMVGITEGQKEFWDKIFRKCTILPLTETEIDIAGDIIRNLRKENNIIGIEDIFIASTAIAHRLKLSTLNLKDFVKIKDLEILQ